MWTDSVPSCSEVLEKLHQAELLEQQVKHHLDPLDSPLKWNLERTRSCFCQALECCDSPSQGMVQVLIEQDSNLIE